MNESTGRAIDAHLRGELERLRHSPSHSDHGAAESGRLGMGHAGRKRRAGGTAIDRLQDDDLGSSLADHKFHKEEAQWYTAS